MKAIGKGSVLIEKLVDKLSLFSSSIERINIGNIDNELVIAIDLKLPYLSGGQNIIRLEFKGVKEYSLYYNDDYIFYNVETYKLLMINDKFYLSLDPDESTGERSLDDQDFILSQEIIGYLCS